jgi:hypothetical protein
MAIPNNFDFEQLSDWLNEILNDKKSIKACCQEVKKVPETKGIYFWFIHPDGYSALKNCIDITPIEPHCTRNINGIMYYLVYLGTAGVRNNKNGINNGNLRKRLKWHLCDNKSISAICSGKTPTMSTYRRTIGALISDDLIANNTQVKIDELLCKHFVIYYIEYPGEFLDVKDEVKNDEDILINVTRPILNLDKNPNTKNPKHITFEIQERRQIVEKDSKKSWCKENPKKNSQDKKDAINTLPKIKKKEKHTQITNMEIKDKCFEEIFTSAEEIKQYFENLKFKKVTWTFQFFETKKPGNIITPYSGCETKFPSEYLGRPDTNKNRRIEGLRKGDSKRWEIIKKEMKDLNIDKVTVRACPKVK